MYFSIQSLKTGKYWQCGVWVDSISQATKYDTEQEAEAVSAFRSHQNCTVVDNTVPFKKVG